MPEVVPFVDLRAQYHALAAEIDPAVTEVFESAAFILGPEVGAFEREFARFNEAEHCVGVESGTAALSVALQAMGVGRGDEVILPANTYIACAFAVSHLGAAPVMVDIDETYAVNVAAIERAITPRTKVLMPVHLYGQAVDLEPILSLARVHGLKVLEDVSQAHGARYRGRRLGSFGDAAAYSFYPGKNLGAYGDGGAIVTKDGEIADRARLLRDFGQREKYRHLIIGDNCRLDSVQAAILRVKLRHLDAWNAQRQAAARRYDELIRAMGLQPPVFRDVPAHVYHLYVVRVPQRDEAIKALAEAGIQTGVHYPTPIHLQPAYAHLGIVEGTYPVTERVAGEILSLPMFPEITEDQINRVARALERHLAGVRAVAQA